MANAPPLPFAPPPAPTGPQFQFPPGTKVVHPSPPFTPEVQKQLDEARRNGKFFIAVVIADPAPDDPDRLLCFKTRSTGFKMDWMLRAWQHICGMIIADGVPTAPAVHAPVVPPPAEVESAASAAATRD